MSSLKSQIQSLLSFAANKITGQIIKPESILVEHPGNPEFGDYSTNLAMTIFNQLKVKSAKLKVTVKSLKLNNNSTIQQPACRTGRFNNPLDLAELIVKELKSNSTTRLPDGQVQQFNNLTIAGPGFINISIKTSYFLEELQKIVKEKEQYGALKNSRPKDLTTSKKIMVEFAHPNTHKAFHIGHLRNISLGESIVRILEANGVKVIRGNYQGDVGIHIAKCLWQLCKGRAFTSQITGGKNDVKARPLHERIEMLSKAYVAGSTAYDESAKSKKEIQDINYLIYASAQKYQQAVHHIQPGSTNYLKFVKNSKYNLETIYKLWVETRQWSLDHFEAIYKRVYSHFDRYYFESQCLQGVDKSYEALKKGILKRSKGAVVFDGTPYNLHTRVFINSLGLPTYEGKELALAPMEFSEFGHLDKIIHVVTPEQTSFFKITFKVEELLGIQKDQQYHLAYNWVKLKKGKMSSRSGNVILGEWLLDEAKKRIKEIMLRPGLLGRPGLSAVETEETAEAIAVGAVKYSFLKVNPSSEIAFDFDESISLSGNSGPYLQYTYARAQSVLRKAQVSQKGSSFNAKPEGKVEPLRNFEEQAILRTIYKFPEIIEQAGRIYNPSLICNFLYDLAQKYNAFYNKHRILTQNSKLKSQNHNLKLKTNQTKFRLLLTQATGQILHNGLYLLGIKTPEKM